MHQEADPTQWQWTAMNALPPHAAVLPPATASLEQPALMTLQRVMQTPAPARSLDETLDAVLVACPIARSYRCAAALFYNPAADRLIGEVAAAPAWVERLRVIVPEGRLPLEFDCRTDGGWRQSRAVQVFQEGRSHITPHLAELTQPCQDATAATALQQQMGIAVIALLPLRTAERRLGVLIIAFGAERLVTITDLPMLEMLAGQAALATENLWFQRELGEREQQVSLLLKATIDAQEEERERICLEIHDGVAQLLAPAFHYLQALEAHPQLPDELRSNIHKAGRLVREASREAREVIATLRPAALDTLGLVATLRYELEELSAQTGRQIEFHADQERYPKTAETTLYRIVHEAVNNVIKHADASRVAVRLTHGNECIIAEVQDNGKGFDPASVAGIRSVDFDAARHRGVGLLSMRKRSELLQGSFELHSKPAGGGTLVRVQLPLLSDDRA